MGQGWDSIMVYDSTVSKYGRHADARLHKNFHNLRKIVAFEQKTLTKKNTSFNLILLILMHFFSVLWPFRHIFMRNFSWLDIVPAK